MSDDRPAQSPLFLFSLPRAGSTLCQRILGSHPDIGSVNEPHILLPLLNSSKWVGTRSTYNHFYASRAIQDFTDRLPGGPDDYLAEIREVALRLYGRASNGERYFLDKTPKYHLIVDDVINLFDQARFLFLWRHPLAVVSSINETWAAGRWNVHHFKIDMLEGIDKLIRAYLKHEDRCHAFRYEDAVLSPEATWSGVFRYLDLPFDPSLLTSFAETRFEGRVRDPNSDLDEFQVIARAPLEKWKTTLNNPLRQRWCRRYLQWLGRERLAVMGYELDILLEELDSLPRTGHELLRDAYRMPVGALYHVLELQLMKQKLMSLRRGEAVYMHN